MSIVDPERLEYYYIYIEICGKGVTNFIDSGPTNNLIYKQNFELIRLNNYESNVLERILANRSNIRIEKKR